MAELHFTEREALNLPYALAQWNYVTLFETKGKASIYDRAERVRSGAGGINTPFVAFPGIPFGGFKESGYGREGGAFGIDEYLDVKYVLMGAVGTV